MRKRLTFALLWLLLAALPMQGIAAATMLFCALPAQSNDAPAATHIHHANDQTGHQHEHGKGKHSNHAGFCAKCMTCSSASITPPIIAELKQSGPGLPPVMIDLLPPAYPDVRGPDDPPRSSLA
jgi:hypothetical protein